MPRLTITGPDQQPAVYEFEDDLVVIGAGASCFVRLGDPGAAPEHFQIEQTPDGRYKLVDLETLSGTEVNGAKVNSHLLENNDRIYVGGTSILFEDLQPKSKTRRIPILRPHRRLRPLLRRRPVPTAPAGAPAPSAAEEALQTERDSLASLIEINKLINSEHNLKKLLEIIMDSVIEMAGAERGFLILREHESLVIKVARNFDRESIRKPEFKVSHSVAEEVLRTGKPILSADALSDPGLPAAGSVADLQLHSLLCVPFRVRDRIFGCVYIDNRFETGIFQEADLPLLQGFADQAALAIENTRLLQENARRQEELRRSKEEIERLNDQLKEKVEKQYAELAKVKQDLDSRRKDVILKHDFSGIVGKSRALQDVFALLDRVIDTDEPVFVHGESGTGKELVSRAIHFNSTRARGGRFVSENCSAIPDTLLESELFGHEKGAFTGAVASKPGLFELAHKGTLFLDEIGDMSVDMQKKLLRAIQEGEIRRVGGKDILKVDVRIISASNKNLADLIKTGQFREDLYYRLNVVKITLPPLRDRKEDIPILVEHLLEKLAREQGQPARKVDDVAWWYLRNYPWPGNVRELENEIRRAVALSDDVIGVDALKEEVRSQDLFKPVLKIPAQGSLKDVVREAIEEVERKIIARTLEETGWKKTEAARRLEISRPTLDAKIAAYKLSRGKAPQNEAPGVSSPG